MPTQIPAQQIENWPIERLVEYPRNPRKNDKAVDRMCASIREFGFKIPVLARSDGEVVDGHLRLKAARKLGVTEIPVILCDEWTAAQVKAFRLMVNRSVTWADWDEELLALELQEIQEADFDLSLTGFDPGEIDGLLAMEDDEKANAASALARISRVPRRRSVAARAAQSVVRRRYECRGCRQAIGWAQATVDGH
jgi:ParB-like chromosome segregation protein Spo0J